ncbi:MAG: rhomboid family intramembrane serine protease [Proteobacteria bacterium]|nr:rhomboid family intramembrane serine protease [Pseudomonadota bacterium]
MKSLRHGLSEENAHTFALVLASQAIDFSLEHKEEGFDLLIREEDHERAMILIDLFLEENREPVSTPTPFADRFHKTYSGLFAAVLIFAIHAQLPVGPHRQSIIAHYGADAAEILHGDIYRLVTALFLHGDDIHLAGNMAGLILFGTSVASITGPGLGWFMVLLTGILGNGMNALFFKSHHLSIGASTAIFGAVGILASYRSIQIFSQKGVHSSTLLPLGAGLALLGLLGASAHADLTAHLFGYFSGLLCGAIYARRIKHNPREWIQVLFLFLSAILIALSWYPPLR